MTTASTIGYCRKALPAVAALALSFALIRVACRHAAPGVAEKASGVNFVLGIDRSVVQAGEPLTLTLNLPEQDAPAFSSYQFEVRRLSDDHGPYAEGLRGGLVEDSVFQGITGIFGNSSGRVNFNPNVLVPEWLVKNVQCQSSVPGSYVIRAELGGKGIRDRCVSTPVFVLVVP